MRSSVELYGNFASFFVCFHGWFVISKSNFKFHCGRADVLEIAFLAMNQINHIWWITREFLLDKIRFACLCARKSSGVDKEVIYLFGSWQRSLFIYILFISRFVYSKCIQVWEQKDITSPTRFHHLTQPRPPKRIWLYVRNYRYIDR